MREERKIERVQRQSDMSVVVDVVGGEGLCLDWCAHGW